MKSFLLFHVVVLLLFPNFSAGSGKTHSQFFQDFSVWPNYGKNISFDLSQAGYDDYSKNLIRSAFANISTRTCLTFQEVTGLQYNYMKFQKTDVGQCYAKPIGYNYAGINVLNVDLNFCGDRMSIVSIIIQALGFFRTTQRVDASQYVFVDNTTLSSQNLMQTVFSPPIPQYPTSIITAYDYLSLTEPGRYELSGNSLSISVYAPLPIGQRYGFSNGDLAELNFMYPCSTSQLVCAVPVRGDETVALGSQFSVNFTVNTGDNSPVMITFTLPSTATSSVPSGSVIKAQSEVNVTFTPSAAQLFQKIPLSILFTSVVDPTISMTCTAMLYVTPNNIPANCFGVLSNDTSNVCSGHGTCVISNTCMCMGGYVGMNCEVGSSSERDSWVTLYNGIPATLSSYTPITPSSSGLVDEDYNLGLPMDLRVLSFELREIVVAMTLNTSTNFTVNILYSDGTPLLSVIATYSGTSTTAINNKLFNYIPLIGRLQFLLPSDGKVYAGNATLATGVDDPLFGTFKPNRTFFTLRGVLRCTDGFYGPLCNSSCPGLTSITTASQCYFRGICNDGTTGTGQCACYDNTTGDCAPIANCSSFPVGSCPPSLPAVRQDGATCTNNKCTYQQCCVLPTGTPTQCQMFNKSNCPPGFIVNPILPCQFQTCYPQDCCVPAPSCINFPSAMCPAGNVTRMDNVLCTNGTCTPQLCCIPDACAVFTDCMTCGLNATCGWCAATNSCATGQSDGPAWCYDWRFDPYACNVTTPNGTKCLTSLLVTGALNQASYLNTIYTRTYKTLFNGKPIYSAPTVGIHGRSLYWTQGSWNFNGDPTQQPDAYNNGSTAEPQMSQLPWYVFNYTNYTANTWNYIVNQQMSLTCTPPACQAFSGQCPPGQVVTRSRTRRCRGPQCTASDCCTVAPVDCDSVWVPLAPCSVTCGLGVSPSVFVIRTPNSNGGKSCNYTSTNVTQNISCNPRSCSFTTTCIPCSSNSISQDLATDAIQPCEAACAQQIIQSIVLTRALVLIAIALQLLILNLVAVIDQAFSLSGIGNYFFPPTSALTFSKPLRIYNSGTTEIQGSMRFTNTTNCNIENGTCQCTNCSITAEKGCRFDVRGGNFRCERCRFYGEGEYRIRLGFAFHRFAMLLIRLITIELMILGGRRPVSDPTAYMCGTAALLVNVSGTLLVDMSSNCTVPGVTASFTATTLIINSGGVLYLANTTVASAPVVINTSLIWNVGGWISVELITVPSVDVTFTVLRYATSTYCSVPIGAIWEVVAKGFTMTGTANLISVSSLNNGTCALQVSYIAPVITPNSTNAAAVPGDTFTIPLDQDCTSFTGATAKSFVGQTYDVTRVTMTTYCGSTILSFFCTGSTVANANAYCQIIYNDITNPNSALYAQLRPIGPASGNKKSNNGLYALFALLAIPVLIVIAIVTMSLLKSRPRHAHAHFKTLAVPEYDEKAVPQYPVASPNPYPITTPYSTPYQTPIGPV